MNKKIFTQHSRVQNPVKSGAGEEGATPAHTSWCCCHQKYLKIIYPLVSYWAWLKDLIMQNLSFTNTWNTWISYCLHMSLKSTYSSTIFAVSNSSQINKVIHKYLSTYAFLLFHIQHIPSQINTSNQSGYNKQLSFPAVIHIRWNYSSIILNNRNKVIAESPVKVTFCSII